MDRQIRYNALKALNQVCFLDRKVATQYCRLYFEICMKDHQEIKNCALEGLIDFIVEHGSTVLFGGLSGEESSSIKEDSKSDVNDDEIDNQLNHEKNEEQTNIGSDKSSNIDQAKENFTNKIASSNQQVSEQLMDKSQFIEFNQTNQLSIEEDQIRRCITKEFIKFLLMFVKEKDAKLNFTSIMGICKLMLLGRIYSPKLLSELILVYYNSNTNQSIVQAIGTFLPIYLNESLKSNIKIKLPIHLTGQYSLIECFMYTIENFYRLVRGQELDSSFDVVHSNYYDNEIDVINVIEFMLNLLEPKNHGEILIEIFEKILEILEIEREDEYQLKEPFIIDYLIRCLNSFKLFELTDGEKIRLKSLVDLIRDQDRFKEWKKRHCSKINKFVLRLES